MLPSLISKTFDTPNYFYLIKFAFLDFPNLLSCKIQDACVLSTIYIKSVVLWNGNKLPPFKPTHGLRQGDPLSPYLFILCMEKLSVAINSAVNQGSWDPIQITNRGPQISHLLIADDVLLFTKA